MDFQFNPFELLQQANVPIKSISVTSNLDWFDTPVDPLTGENVVLEVNAKTSVAALKVFATGSSIGTPSMRSLLAAHIPNIEIAQVNGLQSAINSLVKTLASGHAALVVSNNGAGSYTITPTFGTIANSFAVGNDTRFPASVTGLRKGAGVGSLDIPAVARTDYWDTSDFIASGASHRHGLVPDPGAVAGIVKFLREDGSWQTPAGSGTLTNVATTSPISGGPITTTGTLSLLVNVDFAWTAAQSIKLSNSSTAVADPLFTFGHNSSGTPVAGFGGRLKYQLKSSTTNDQDAGFLDVAWSDPAHPTRTAYMDFQLALSAAMGSRMRLWGDGGLSVNNTTDPGAGVVSAANFKGTVVTSALLKATGTGLHAAAVAKTDYWDLSTFGPVGVSHAIGLVPDPGAGGATGRFLNEDGTWKVFTPANGSLTNAMLVNMAAKTLKANATAGVAAPTDVTALVARSASLLNLESQTPLGTDADYTILSTDRYVYPTTTITSRTWSLPLANSVNSGHVLTIADPRNLFGGVVTVQRQGADALLPGNQPSFALDQRGGSITVVSDGVSKWYITNVTPSVRRRIFTANTTHNLAAGVKAILIECIAGGGGGAGAVAAASNGSAGAGGGGGGYASILVYNVAGNGYGVTVGAAGAGGAAGNNNGATGGNSAYGGFCTAVGGVGGTAGTSGNTVVWTTPGDGGLPTTGDVLFRGSAGFQGYRASGTQGLSGYGGGSGDGGGTTAGRFTEGAGANAVGYGNGGAGALSLSASSFAGGNGTQGVVIITEYY